ncbi:hypothetical protein Tco_0698966 [Tanacetum coccineum]
MKAITTRSGVAYEGPSIPTKPSPKKVVERETEKTTDKVRIMQKSQENGQNQTNSDTGMDRVETLQATLQVAHEEITDLEFCLDESEARRPSSRHVNSRARANDGVRASDSVGGVEHTARGCSYKEFLKCKPRNFNGTEGTVGLTRWFEKMELSIGIDAAYQTPWKDLKKMMTEEYCPRNELQKMEGAIRMAHDLMDQVVQTKAVKNANNKRK